MARLPTRFVIFRSLWSGDAAVSASLFETWDGIKRGASAYSSFLYRYFRISGWKRVFVDLADDMATFGTIIAFVLLAYAVPPFSGTGDWWNRGREYAVTFTDSSGEIIGQRGIRQDDAIPLEEIPSNLIKAVLATEDVRFFDHFGVDVIGTLRAVIRNARASGVVQGGSSITQQVAKNLFLSPERTMRRKIHEAFLSMWIEARLSKQEILKLYLDRSYLGGGAYGVEAAAQFYFGKSVRDINIAESAVLAGLFKAPTSYAPHANPDASRGRASVVLYRMLDAGFITQGELLQARRTPPQIVATKDASAPDWFLDWAYQDTLAILEKQRLNSDFVIEVKTTIDRGLQEESQKIINEVVDTEGGTLNFSQAASVTMTPDGGVKAIVGGRDYEVSQFNRATDAERQSGSAFKPFVYLAALLDGFTPDQTVVDGPVSIGGWSPKNYNGDYAGRTTLSTALAKSYNSVPVKLSIVVGRPAIIKAAHDAGIRGELETWAPMVLGTSSLTLLDLTTGYATFAAGGRQATPYAVLEIRRPTGDVIYSRQAHTTDSTQTIPASYVADLNSMLAEVVKAGTARKADLGYAPQGGKTGTNQSYRDAWYIGFTAHNVTGVWVGNDDFSPMHKVTGGMIPAPTWKRIMEVAERGQTPASIAGIPLDESFERVAVTDVPVTDTEAPPTVEESPDASPELIAEPTDDVKDVLDGMFALFEKTPKSKKDASKKLASGKPIALPKTNADGQEKANFIDRLFSNGEKKKRKKKVPAKI